MVILSSFKHGKFKQVDIPRNSELVRAFGLTSLGSKYSGDEFLKPNMTKVEIAKEVEKESFDEPQHE